MIIDIIFVVLLGLAFFKGGSKGLIVAVFSLLGFIIGMAAAMNYWALDAFFELSYCICWYNVFSKTWCKVDTKICRVCYAGLGE